MIEADIERFGAAQAVGCPIKNLGIRIDQDRYLNEQMQGGGRLVLAVQINKEALVMFAGALSLLKIAVTVLLPLARIMRWSTNEETLPALLSMRLMRMGLSLLFVTTN